MNGIVTRRWMEFMVNMDVGDSFLWHEHDAPTYAAIRLGIKLKRHKVSNKPERISYRIWRIK